MLHLTWPGSFLAACSYMAPEHPSCLAVEPSVPTTGLGGLWFYEVIPVETSTWARTGISYLPKSCGQYLPGTLSSRFSPLLILSF